MIPTKILVAGCGGLGCYIVEMLVRMGVGELTVADGDVFDEGNMNRQLYASRSTLGRSKVEVAKEHAMDINPGIRFNAYSQFITEDNCSELLSGCSIAVDALDNVKSRKLLAEACAKAGIPLVYGAIGEYDVQASVVMPGDKLLDIIYTGDCAKQGTHSFVPPFCASLQVALVNKLLSGEKAETGLYLAGLDDIYFEKVKM